ncbi:MAG: low specificity L-threonine aldolase [Deltaproteobacteria bacterium]|jgi:threonine aldolase|nr:low specificity L-threonine aldolase [Deltaproteobacteria bacterium]
MKAELKNQFASDNYAGVCPEAWQALSEANRGYATSYGNDLWTKKACDALRDFFETDCEVFFVFNGTAGNSLALAAMCHSYHSVICHETAHVETDECGASEFFSNGTKLLTVPGPVGKVDLIAVEKTVMKRSDIHYPKPKVLSITQPTELGTVYTPKEMAAVHGLTQRLGLKLHVDGARFANAVSALGVSPKELTWQVGVDVLTFGGTKCGLPFGEAVVFFDKSLAFEFDYRCKQAGQLASKMRYLSAPWVGLIEGKTMLDHAAHANLCAQRLSRGITEISGATVVYPTEANAVFVQLPEAAIDLLRSRGWVFYTFIGSGHCRFMCSWATTDTDIDSLLADLRDVLPS